MSKVTFKEVAELAGVSTQTVSRVTNNASNVNPETRRKVQEAIDKLGYVPNKGAQLLVRKKAKIFGVITLDISLQGASRIVEGIRNESKKEGYAISLAVVNESKELDTAIRELLSQQVEAILINIPVEKDLAESIVAKYSNTPFVFIDTAPETKVNHVTSDNLLGGELAARLMVEQGRTTFALINGPEISPAAWLRKEAWMNVLEENKKQIIFNQHGDWSARSGYINAMDLFSKAQACDAILVANDQMAIGVLRACYEHKIKVPQQVAIIGFDDTENSEFFSPPLSTIRQNFIKVGHQAVGQIMKCLVDEQKPCEEVLVPVELIERKSTAPKKEGSEKMKRFGELLDELKDILPDIQ